MGLLSLFDAWTVYAILSRHRESAISPLVISFFRGCRWDPPMLFSRFLRRLDKLKGWKKDVAVGLIVSAVCTIGGGLWWGTTQIYHHWHESETPPDAHARMRILEVVAVPMSASGAQFPALNIYYQNAGPLTATSIVNRFAAGFGGALSTEAVKAEQDKLLRWDGWESAMAARQQYEMHPGDPGEFTSIPNMEGVLAEQFRTNWDKVRGGTIVLHVFMTFKYLDQSMPKHTVGVTEDCFWFSGGFARHNCGRGRAFLEKETMNTGKAP